MSVRCFFITNAIKSLSPTKYSIAFIIAIASCQTQAAPSNFGTFTSDVSPQAGSVASGRYTTTMGATGSYTLLAGASNGYNGRAFTVGNNGIEIRNDANTDIANDRFNYIFAITPDNNTAIHTIKIGQATYTTTGNSEVARHTLSFTKNPVNNITATATVSANPDVPYYYEAMGDYFMGQRVGNTSNFTYDNPVNSPQLRLNSDSKLYFYRLDFLNGTNLAGNGFRPSTTNNEARVRNNAGGFLPSPATFTNILKSTSTSPNNQSTFSALAVGTSTNNTQNVQYVSYGIANADSDYVVAVKNANTVTLTYEGIMNGNNAFVGEVVGETFREWISFGVESELVNYVFSGTIYNDNGGIDDVFATNNPDIIGDIYNNGQYFNGEFDSNELGITSSTVSLASNCNSTAPTIISTQTVTAANGEYNFTVPISTINTSNSICIIEDNNSGYPIRTTSAKQPISFISDQYLYEDINFGRVIAANKALVLEKEQALNDCNITALPPSMQNNLSYSKVALTGVDPGQCIAYRITATNRANLEIKQVVITDILQKKDLSNSNGPRVTSVLSLPQRMSVPNSTYNDNIQYGENGTIITSKFDIPIKNKQVFYFNTRYGTTRSGS